MRAFAKITLMVSTLLAVITATVTVFPILVIYAALRGYVFFGLGALLLLALVGEGTGVVLGRLGQDRRSEAYLVTAMMIALVAFIIWLFWLYRLVVGGWGPA